MIKLQAPGLKETPIQKFSCRFFQIFKDHVSLLNNSGRLLLQIQYCDLRFKSYKIEVNSWKMCFCVCYFSLSFFWWYTEKESSMNTIANKNFISLPSGSGYFIFRSPWDILPCVLVLFFLKHFPKIHRSVLCKIKIDLLYFWDVYDVNLWEKNFGRSTAYSCRTNVFI